MGKNIKCVPGATANPIRKGEKGGVRFSNTGSSSNVVAVLTKGVPERNAQGA